MKNKWYKSRGGWIGAYLIPIFVAFSIIYFSLPTFSDFVNLFTLPFILEALIMPITMIRELFGTGYDLSAIYFIGATISFFIGRFIEKKFFKRRK